MPRIGGGSGPIIPPQPAGANQASTSTQKAGFADKIAQHQGTDAARAQQSKDAQASQLVGKTKEIAKRLKAGAISQKDATREFVGLVIEERFPNLKKRKKKQGDQGEEGEDGDERSQEDLIEEAVSELIERDPILARQLERQFKRLAG